MTKGDTRSAFQYGLAIFTLTALLGLANATQLLGSLDRNTLLTHLHSGTLGWITMGVIGLTIWVFGGSGLGTAVRLSALSTAFYVVAFWSGNFLARALFGATELLVILAWWWYATSRAARIGFGRVDVAKLSFVLGLTTLLIGSTLGVIVQILFATGQTVPTSPDLIGAHASAQTGGYLVLVAAGFIEHQLGSGGRSRAGLAQVALLFVGGLLLAFSLLDAAQLGPALAQALPGIATLLTLAGIIIAVVRLAGPALAASRTTGGRRHIAVGLVFLVVAVVLQAVLVQQFVAAQGDVSKVSQGLLHALDHAYFIGLMTNVLFGAILVHLSASPRGAARVDGIVFWGLNLGAAAFIAVLLIAGSGEGARPFSHPVSFTAPVMGLAALLGIAVLLRRLQGSPPPREA